MSDQPILLRGVFAPVEKVAGAYQPAIAIKGVCDMALRANLAGVRVLGKRWEFAIEVKDAQGQPKDLTGATVTMAIGASAATKYAEATATLADQEEETGKATAVFLPSVTDVLTLPSTGRMFYQVDILFDASNKDTVAYGQFAVQRSLI